NDIPLNLFGTNVIGRESKHWPAKFAKEVLAVFVMKMERVVAMENNREKFRKGQLPGGQIIEGKLTKDDATDRIQEGSLCKVHTIQLAAGKLYRIDLVSPDFNTFLRLEDLRRRPLAATAKVPQPPDTSSVLFISTRRSGQYRLIATSDKAGETGRYYLGVQELAPAGKPIVVSGTLKQKGPLAKGRPYQIHP